jgi:hypothetical protein
MGKTDEINSGDKIEVGLFRKCFPVILKTDLELKGVKMWGRERQHLQGF